MSHRQSMKKQAQYYANRGEKTARRWMDGLDMSTRGRHRHSQARRIDFVDDAALSHQALGPYQWTPNPAGDLDRAN